MNKTIILLILLISSALAGCSAAPKASSKRNLSKSPVSQTVKQPTLSKHDGGFFTISRPEGWKVQTAGRGSTLAFLVRDPACSSRQIFCFTSVGPFYTSESHKATEVNYMQSGGYPIQWIDMPVVSPLTASSFFSQFKSISRTSIARGFMPDMPKLDQFTVISVSSAKAPAHGFTAQTIRAVFKQDGKVAQGLFTAAVGEVKPYGWAYLVTGITAPFKEFEGLAPAMVKSLASFNLSKEYVDQCLREQSENFKGLLKAGDTMRETSDIITKGWAERTKTYDIIAEKRSDSILGKDRYYDPATRDVWEYPVGHQPKAGLEPLPPDDWDLWMKPTKYGE